jgi:SAM-dependent methyltransferase
MERLTTDSLLYNTIAEHLHRYALASALAPGKKVLDIACGEGYGAHLLAMQAAMVTGIDIEPTAIAAATSKYRRANLQYQQGSILNIPATDNSYDLVVSFETLEHVADHEKVISELRRVLKPNGVLIISTPERDNYRRVDPANPFHVKEITADQFVDLLAPHFPSVCILRQCFLRGSFITSDNNIPGPIQFFKGDFDSFTASTIQELTIYNLAVCSDAPVSLPASAFDASGFVKQAWQADNLQHWQQYQALKNSASYRLGNLIVDPLAKLLRLTGWKK